MSLYQLVSRLAYCGRNWSLMRAARLVWSGVTHINNEWYDKDHYGNPEMFVSWQDQLVYLVLQERGSQWEGREREREITVDDRAIQ